MITRVSSDPLILRALTTCPDWLGEKVLPYLKGYPDPDACWLWGRATDDRGYPRVRLPMASGSKAVVLVRRVLWLAERGPIPDGMVLGEASCVWAGCANPFQVELVTARASVANGTSASAVNSRKTHCPKGHPLEGDNLVPASLKRGERACLKCARESSYRNWLKKTHPEWELAR